MSVTAIIRCRNGGPFLAEALESLAIQDLPPREAVLCHEGCSEDGEWARRALETSLPFPLQEISLGPAPSLTAVVRAIPPGTGEHLLFLEARDKLVPGALSEFAGYLRRHRRVGAAWGNSQEFGTSSARRYAPPALDGGMSGEWLPEAFLLRRRAWKEPAPDHPPALHGRNIGRLVLFRRRGWRNKRPPAAGVPTAAGNAEETDSRNLFRTDAPCHTVFTEGRYLPPPGAFSDLAILSMGRLAHFLQSDRRSRFLWLGCPDLRRLTQLQTAVNWIGADASVGTIGILRRNQTVLSIIIDRLALLKKRLRPASLNSRTLPPGKALIVNSQETPVSLVPFDPRLGEARYTVQRLSPGLECSPLPAGALDGDPRSDAALSWWLGRPPLIPRRIL